MNISFRPLVESDFAHLLKWLESSHIKKWWDQDIIWNIELIRKRYKNYTKGYKVLILCDGSVIQKPIYAFIIIGTVNKYYI